MNPERPFRHVPRRALNGAVILGGILGIVLQSQRGWGALTTFVITLTLCGACALAVALIFSLRRR